MNLLLSAIAAYLVAGIMFGLAFIWRGAGQLDPAAQEGSLGFKVLILPGCVALWPLLARRWYRDGTNKGNP